MMNDWDIENSKREAVEEALAEGIAKGKAEGKAEGMEKEKIAIATKMLEDGVPVEMITKYTGLSEEQINRL